MKNLLNSRNIILIDLILFSHAGSVYIALLSAQSNYVYKISEQSSAERPFFRGVYNF